MTKRDEAAAVKAVAVDEPVDSLYVDRPPESYSCRQGVWSAVDSDLLRARDVSGYRQVSSAIDSVLSSGHIRVSFGICF